MCLTSVTFPGVEQEQFQNTVIVRSENGGGTKNFNFQSYQKAKNVTYSGEVTLTHRFSNSIEKFWFGTADCGNMGMAVQGDKIYLHRYYRRSLELWMYLKKWENYVEKVP